jgi:hypothetical protein
LQNKIRWKKIQKQIILLIILIILISFSSYFILKPTKRKRELLFEKEMKIDSFSGTIGTFHTIDNLLWDYDHIEYSYRVKNISAPLRIGIGVDQGEWDFNGDQSTLILCGNSYSEIDNIFESLAEEQRYPFTNEYPFYAGDWKVTWYPAPLTFDEIDRINLEPNGIIWIKIEGIY